MCLIEFGKPVKHNDNDLRNGVIELDNMNRTKHDLVNKKKKRSNHKAILIDNNFVIVPKDPILYLAHMFEHSIVFVEQR